MVDQDQLTEALKRNRQVTPVRSHVWSTRRDAHHPFLVGHHTQSILPLISAVVARTVRSAYSGMMIVKAAPTSNPIPNVDTALIRDPACQHRH